MQSFEKEIAGVACMQAFMYALDGFVKRKWWTSDFHFKGTTHQVTYMLFEVAPDDVHLTQEIVNEAIDTYGGTTRWSLQLYKPAHYSLWPAAARLLQSSLGADALSELIKSHPDLPIQLARDLFTLAVRTHRVAEQRGVLREL